MKPKEHMKPNGTSSRVLVAGVGNIFLGDDAFGVEVARRLERETLPEGVSVVDVGLRSMQLVYRLLDGRYDRVILVDAVARGGAPGTLYVLEPEDSGDASSLGDAHGLRPEHVASMLRRLGGTVATVLVVGCEPARVDEEAGLSPPVAAAVEEAVRLVLEVATGTVHAPDNGS